MTLFELDIEQQPVGGHIGGCNGSVVACPCCGRSACHVGSHRYAHQLRLVRSSQPTLKANKDLREPDVRHEWGRVCTAEKTNELVMLGLAARLGERADKGRRGRKPKSAS